MQAYDYNNLFYKAKLYIQRALNEDRESDLFPFWLSLSLELLARSSLAKINPILLAEVSSNDGGNLLYALGYETTTKPKSIQISEVFQRLSKIVTDLTQNEVKLASTIIDQRNTELHSGIKGFANYPPSIWLSDYYKLCKILLGGQGLNLIDLLGTEEAKAAEQMIKEEAANVKKLVLSRIESFKTVFFDYSISKQEELKKAAIIEINKHINKAKIVKCPVCESKALLTGELISVSEAKLIDYQIRVEERYLPSNLGCFTCGITLNGYSALKVIDLGGQFTLEENIDALEYHGIDPEDYVNIDDLVEKHLRQINDFNLYGDE